MAYAYACTYTCLSLHMKGCRDKCLNYAILDSNKTELGIKRAWKATYIILHLFQTFKWYYLISYLLLPDFGSTLYIIYVCFLLDLISLITSIPRSSQVPYGSSRACKATKLGGSESSNLWCQSYPNLQQKTQHVRGKHMSTFMDINVQPSTVRESIGISLVDKSRSIKVILLMGPWNPENSPVEGQVVYLPLFTTGFIHHPRWCRISEPSTVVGGWTTGLKNMRKSNWKSSPNRGENKKIIETTT